MRRAGKVNVAGAVGAAALFILIVYPLATLVVQIVLPHLFSVHMSWGFSLGPIRAALADPNNLSAVINSAVIALGGTAIAGAVGLVTAISSAQATSRTWKLLTDVFVWVVLFTPSFIIAQGWVVLMQDGGAIADLFHLQAGWSDWFFTRLGLTLVMGFKYFPFVYIAVSQGLKNIGAQYGQAASMSGASRRQVWTRIVIPLLLPGLLAGLSIAFAEGFGDFGFAAAITPATRIPMAAYQVYAAMSQAPVDFSSAALMSSVLIAVTAGALSLQFWWLGRKSYATVSASSESGAGVQTGRLVHFVAGGLMFVSLALPVGGSVLVSLWKVFFRGVSPGNWTGAQYRTVLSPGSPALHALGASLSYGVITAVTATLLALWLGYQLSFQRSKVNHFINLITMASIAIPGVVLAAGYIFAWNAAWVHAIHLVTYGTSTCLAMAYIAGQVPYAVRLQLGAMSQLSPNLLFAARLIGARDLRIMASIVAPLVRATVISTFFLAFTQAIFELPASMLLYPAGHPTFSVVAEVAFSAFRWPLGSAIAVVGMAVVLMSYAVGRRLAALAGPRQVDVAQAVAVPERGDGTWPLKSEMS